MKFYTDIDGGYWFGTEDLGVVFIHPDMIEVGFEYKALTWSLESATGAYGLKELNVG